MSFALDMPNASAALKESVLRETPTDRTDLRSLLKEMVASVSASPAGDLDKVAEALAEQTAVNGEKVIAAAVVVLSHATADDAFTVACESAIELDPANWISELNMERKVSLGLLRDKGLTGVFALELERLRQQVSGKSLPSRAELFFRRVNICHHPRIGPTDEKYFRLSKLAEADELRNNIVHGSSWSQIDREVSKRTTLFLHEAALTAMRSLAASYRLPLERSILLGGGSE